MSNGRPFALPSDLGLRPAPKFTPLTRAVIATCLASMRKPNRPEELARKLWGGDRDVELVLRAAASPTTLAGAPGLAQVAQAFLATLIPVSAGADLLGRGVQLSFDGAAQISLPALTIPIADFVGEGQSIPAVAATSSAVILVPHKLGVLTSLSAEMLRSPAAEQLVRQALIDATGPAIDKVLLSANAAASDRPAGILNGVAGLTPTAAGGAKSEILVDDLQKLAAAIAPVAGNGNIVLVASSDAYAALVMRLPRSVEWPLLASSSLAAKTVIAVAANALVSVVDGTPQIDASQDVDWISDTAPPSDGSLGATRYSSFQKDVTVLRLRWPISWCLRTPAAVAWMSSVNW